MLWGGVAQAEVKAAIVEWGEVTATQLGDAPPGQQGYGLSPEGTIAGMAYINHSNTIAAQLCRMYGFTVWLAAGPGEALPAIVEVHIRHPQFTRPDGATSTEDGGPSELEGGVAQGSFSFDHPWELQPGTWTIEVVFDRRVLASRDYTVVLPAPDTPPHPCDGPPQA